MRRLAAALGAGTMSLYNHVSDKADLQSLLLDAVFMNAAIQEDDAPWDEKAKAALRAIRDAVNRHPALAPLLPARPTASAAALRPIEALLSALRQGGFQDRELLQAYHLLFGYLTGSILTDPAGPSARERKRSTKEVASEIAALDLAAFPNLASIAAIAETVSADEEFEFGLKTIFAGLAP